MSKSNVKGLKALQALVIQLDTVLPTLAGKDAANILIEKASIIRQQIEMEQDIEERKAEADAADAAAKTAELNEQLSAAAAKIKELTEENARLDKLSKTREVVTVSDPNHAAVNEERDLLQKVLTSVVSSMSEEDRAENAVKGLMWLSAEGKSADVAAGQSLCKLLGVDHWNLSGYLTYTESVLRGLQTARDSNGVLVRAVLAVKYSAPVKPTAPTVYVPDTRSGEEKLRDAKASVRQSWTHL